MKTTQKIATMTALVLSAIMAIGGTALAVPTVEYDSAVEARNAAVGTKVSVRGAIVSELQSGKFLVRDASGYIVLDVDRTAPYYTALERDVMLVDKFSGGEEERIVRARTIADPDKIVEIVGTVANGKGRHELQAESITIRNVEPSYSNTYDRFENDIEKG